MTTPSLVVEAELLPRDPLLFGDLRSMRPGDDHERDDQDPTPSTLFGALGGRISTALGADGRRDWARVHAVLGDFRDWDTPAAGYAGAALLGHCVVDPASNAWFPRPLSLRLRRIESRTNLSIYDAGTLVPGDTASLRTSAQSVFPRSLQPASGSPLTVDDEIDEPWMVERAVLGEVLAGRSLGKRDLRYSTCSPDRLFDRETRFNIGMTKDANVPADGLLFARPLRRYAQRAVAPTTGAVTRGRAGFRAWLRLAAPASSDPGAWNGIGQLGGDRRRVDVRFRMAADPLADLREAVITASGGSGGFLLYALTPLPVRAGEWPPRALGVKPCAAALGRVRAVAGWNRMALRSEGPRAAVNVVEEGSVLYYEWPATHADPAAREQAIRELWLTSLDRGLDAHGFGRVLVGVWR